MVTWLSNSKKFTFQAPWVAALLSAVVPNSSTWILNPLIYAVIDDGGDDSAPLIFKYMQKHALERVGFSVGIYGTLTMYLVSSQVQKSIVVVTINQIRIKPFFEGFVSQKLAL